MRASWRDAVAAAAAALCVVLVSGCAPAEPVTFTAAEARAARLSDAQIANLGAEAADFDETLEFTAADFAAAARGPDVVEPESCRGFLVGLTVPGEVLVGAEDLESTDEIVVGAHLDLDEGFVEQAFRVLPDAGAATDFVAALRAQAEGCPELSYGRAGNVNRFDTVEVADLPFEGDGYLTALTVSGSVEVVRTDEIYVMRFGNVVATVRGTADRTEPFAQAVSDNFRATE